MTQETEIDSHLKTAVEKVNRLSELDFAYEGLGADHNFYEAEQTARRTGNYLSSVLEGISRNKALIDRYLVDEGLAAISKTVDAFIRKTTGVESLVSGGVAQAGYKDQRNSLNDWFKTESINVRKKLFNLESSITLAKLSEVAAYTPKIKEIEEDAKEQYNEIVSTNSQAFQILDSLRVKLDQHVRDEASQNFSKLAGKHELLEFNWMVAFVISSAFTIIFILIAVCTFESTETIPELIGSALNRALLVSAPALLMRICLSKYNLERNLRILYNHRDTVLDQYRLFESLIDESDHDSKNQFRLEIAKLIFNDPETGYTKQSPSNEVNISSFLGGERAFKSFDQ